MAGGGLAATENHVPDERLTWSEGFGLGPGKRQDKNDSIVNMNFAPSNENKLYLTENLKTLL